MWMALRPLIVGAPLRPAGLAETFVEMGASGRTWHFHYRWELNK
jgi:hypothetical protein